MAVCASNFHHLGLVLGDGGEDASIGRSLLLGLEVLVAADIVKTIVLDLTFTSLGLLAGLVVVRTFLSWFLFLEIEGHRPWQQALLPTRIPSLSNRIQVRP
jgi:glycopeptide antibiotics resistance protein